MTLLNLDEGRVVDTIHLVFNKAFDMIFHSILVSKLGQYCLQGRVTRWVKNRLGCQAQRVMVNGSYSAWRRVTSGAPQRCTVEPVLSNVFTNNQEGEEVKHTLIKFANHTKRKQVADRLEGRAPVQSRNLTFNTGKYRALLLGWTNPSDATGWGLDGLESRAGEVLVDSQLNVRQQQPLAVMGLSIPRAIGMPA